MSKFKDVRSNKSAEKTRETTPVVQGDGEACLGRSIKKPQKCLRSFFTFYLLHSPTQHILQPFLGGRRSHLVVLDPLKERDIIFLSSLKERLRRSLKLWTGKSAESNVAAVRGHLSPS